MARKVYLSDISREQFEPIREMLERARYKTSPREVDLGKVFCAMLFLLKNGCAWRAIPGFVDASFYLFRRQPWSIRKS